MQRLPEWVEYFDHHRRKFCLLNGRLHSSPYLFDCNELSERVAYEVLDTKLEY